MKIDNVGILVKATPLSHRDANISGGVILLGDLTP
jgi:hypothetical protein